MIKVYEESSFVSCPVSSEVKGELSLKVRLLRVLLLLPGDLSCNFTNGRRDASGGGEHFVLLEFKRLLFQVRSSILF